MVYFCLRWYASFIACINILFVSYFLKSPLAKIILHQARIDISYEWRWVSSKHDNDMTNWDNRLRIYIRIVLPKCSVETMKSRREVDSPPIRSPDLTKREKREESRFLPQFTHQTANPPPEPNSSHLLTTIALILPRVIWHYKEPREDERLQPSRDSPGTATSVFILRGAYSRDVKEA